MALLTQGWVSGVRPRTLVALAWSVAVVATAGSLYFSEVMGLIPCKLCWVQRIFMYPLTVFLAVAYLRQERRVDQYVLPLAVPGAATSLYHYLLQKVPALRPASATCGPVPCTDVYFNWFGFVTIPFLALTAFVLITAAMLLLRRAERAHHSLREAGA